MTQGRIADGIYIYQNHTPRHILGSATKSEYGKAAGLEDMTVISHRLDPHSCVRIDVPLELLYVLEYDVFGKLARLYNNPF